MRLKWIIQQALNSSSHKNNSECPDEDHDGEHFSVVKVMYHGAQGIFFAIVIHVVFFGKFLFHFVAPY